MSNLPSGWAMVELQAVADTQLGKTLSRSAREGQCSHPYLRNKNVRWHGFDLDDLREMSFTSGEKVKYELQTGDLLVCEGGEFGRCAVWQDHRKLVFFQNALHRVRTRDGVVPSWIEFILRLYSETGRLREHASGVTISHLTQTKLRQLRLPLAPTVEQERIVERIDKAFARLDAVETRLKSLLEKLDCLRSAILADAFHAGRDLPPRWKLTTIGAVCLQVNKNDPRKFPDSEFVYIDIGGVGMATGKIEKTRTLLGMEAPSRARQVVKAGDTLLSTVRTYQKKTAVVPSDLDRAIASTGFSVLRPSDVVHPHFLFYQVFSDGLVKSLNEKQTGTSYPAVRDKDVRAMPFRLPPLAQQEAIAYEIEDQFTRLDLTKDLVRSLVGRVALLRQSVLAEAFAGRLVPQDPDDEPASVLLERIAASRPAKPKRRRKVRS